VRQPDPLPNSFLPANANVIASLDEVNLGNSNVESMTALSAAPGQRLRLRGWAIDRVGPRLAGGIDVLIDGNCILSTQTTKSRPDIAAIFGSGVADCEFDAAFLVPALRSGSHALTIRALSARRDAFSEIARIDLRIRPEPGA
jgi:hypothetical protein